MSDGKLSEKERYQNLKRETEIVGQAHDLLMTGRFPGGAAMALATCQAYLKGLYNHMNTEVSKMAPLEPKLEDKAISNDSSNASQPANSGAMQA